VDGVGARRRALALFDGGYAFVVYDPRGSASPLLFEIVSASDPLVLPRGRSHGSLIFGRRSKALLAREDYWRSKLGCPQGVASNLREGDPPRRGGGETPFEGSEQLASRVNCLGGVQVGEYRAREIRRHSPFRPRSNESQLRRTRAGPERPRSCVRGVRLRCAAT